MGEKGKAIIGWGFLLIWLEQRFCSCLALLGEKVVTVAEHQDYRGVHHSRNNFRTETLMIEHCKIILF
jgi:hypothetical protein